MSPSQPRIAIVGAGAVGAYYGGRLAQMGADVHFLFRSDYDVVQRDGLHLFSPQGDAHLHVQAHACAASIGPCDWVIIALKATSNAALLEILPPLLHECTALLTLQNGLGNEEFLAQQWGAERVYGGLCFVCIHRLFPGVIKHIAQGRISLGKYLGVADERAHEMAHLLQEAGVECAVEPSLAAARWKKLVWNIPFNGLSITSGGKDTEAILNDPILEWRVRELMQEIIQTARSLGHEMPDGLAEELIERTRTMSAYRPSSLIDFQAGREVEWEEIWQRPITTARQAGLMMPLTQALTLELGECLRRRQAEASAASERALQE